MIYLEILKEFDKLKILTKRDSWQDRKKSFNFYETNHYFKTFNLKNITGDEEYLAKKHFQPSLPWADIHFLERISGYPLNPTPSHLMWANHTSDHLDPSGKFSHTYPERYWYSKCVKEGYRYSNGDLNDVISILSKDFTTRQAYLPIYLPEDLKASLDNQRVPCTLGYHFTLRQGFYYQNIYYLDIAYFMRSTDILRHLNNDLYLTWKLAKYIIEKLKDHDSKKEFSLGQFSFFTSNLHCFEDDLYTLNKRIEKLEEKSKIEN